MKRYLIFSALFICLFSLIITTGSSAQYNPRFVDNGDGTITDTASGLMWIKTTPSPLFKYAVTWLEAQEECEKMKFAGYSDWRLPTVKEWKTIIDTKYHFPALINPNPLKNVITHLPYWSASEYNNGLECALRSYVVQLYFGQIRNQRKDTRALVWPVRSTRKIAKATEHGIK